MLLVYLYIRNIRVMYAFHCVCREQFISLYQKLVAMSV